jgi:FtsZ-interacting cell division protein YlmF
MNRLMAFLGFDDAEVEDDDGPANGDGVETPKRRGQLFGLSTQKQTEIVVLQPGTFEDARAAADYLSW